MSGTTTAGAKSEADLVIRAQHTPTPWKVSEKCPTEIIGGIESVTDVVGSDTDLLDIANAAFVVRAVNAHDELVEALERIVDHDPTTPGLHYDSLEQLIESAVGIARAALSKAGAAQ